MSRTSNIVLGTQYFRPPFPRNRYWEDDFRAMRDAGLNAVQFWLVWGWCEPEPGRFEFSDYDRLCELAGKYGIGVVLSTLPEINPFWLPRVVPDGAMGDVEGNRLSSGPRGECLSGLVPGSCSDHPEIRKRMTGFLESCGAHFGQRAEVIGWDCWNENRWRNQAPDLVCFCEHSLRSFRAFLKRKYVTLELLGAAWGRRVSDWADVRVGRLASNCYPEMHDFTAWMQDRASEMAKWRVGTIRKSDPNAAGRRVGTHTGNPSIFGGTNLNENIFSRGVDWDIAAGDVYGFSSFPSGGTDQDTDKDIDTLNLCVRMS